MNIAFFDFDGTITNRDSFMLFTLYITGYPKFILGLFLLSPFFLLYKMKIVTNQFIKSTVIKFFYKGINIKDIEEKSKRFNLEVIKTIIRDKAMMRIQWHKNNNHKIVVVSASSDLWIGSWCRENKLDYITTKLEQSKGALTGNLIGTNCFGPEKVTRIKAKYDLSKYDKVFAYGDSRGDREMLEIADESNFKPFT